MSGVVFEPNTSEARKKLQDLARHTMITRLLEDITIDMQVCDIEGWDKTEYLKMLEEAIPKCK